MNNVFLQSTPLSDQQKKRIEAVRTRYVSSPNLDSILADIHRCRIISQCGGQPECMLILGEPGSGKTTLCEQYLRMNPRKEEAERTYIPVFSAEFPDKTVPRQAAISFLEELGHELSPKGLSAPQLTKQLSGLMTQCGVEVSLLDEFQHLIETKSYQVLGDVAKWLKVLINTSKLPVILFGMPYSQIILDCDEQLARRFMVQRTIKPFRLLDRAEREEFRIFLKVFAEGLPFTKTPKLHSIEFYPRLFAFSKGNMARLRNLINYAVEKAILNDDQELTLDHFSAAYHYYLKRISHKDQIDARENLENQANPFDVRIEELEFKELETASHWKMEAARGETRIMPAKYTSLIPIRSLLKRR